MQHKPLNEVILRGTVRGEPEQTDTTRGVPVANFKLDVPVSLNSDGNHSIQVRCYTDAALFCWGNIHDKSLIRLKGYLREERWTTRNTGENVSKTVVIATQFIVEEIQDERYAEISRSN